MAHPYTTRERLGRALRGVERLAALLDEAQAGIEQSGLFDDVIERAANLVDVDLAAVYVVPFSAVTDSPATPGIVSDLTDYMAATLLYEAAGNDQHNFFALYRDTLERVRARAGSIPGAALVDADDAQVGIVGGGSAPTFAGTTCSGRRKTSGMF